MATLLTPPSTRLTTRTSRLLLLLWLIAAVAASLGLQLFLTAERGRDTRQWAGQLDLLASGKAQGITQWMEERRSALNGLTDNVSLRLYMTEITAEDASLPVSEAQLTYLHHLLSATAASNGFSSLASADGGQMQYLPGLAITDAGGAILVATEGFLPLEHLPAELKLDRSVRRPIVSGFHDAAQDFPLSLAFRWPVFAVQADEAMSEPVGYIIGVAPVDARFARFLVPTKQQRQDISFTLYSPAKQGMVQSLSIENDILQLAHQPDTDAALRTTLTTQNGLLLKELNDTPWVVYARAVTGTPWVVTANISYPAAMQETAERAFWMKSTLAFVALAGALLIISLWRHASAERNKELARYHRDVAHTIEQHEALLELIATNTPVATYLLDGEMRLRYANEKAATQFRRARETLNGTPIEQLAQSARGQAIITAAYHALKEKQEHHFLWKDEHEGVIINALQSRFIPLSDLPGTEPGTQMQGVLVIEEDVTELLREEAKRNAMLSSVVATLVELVDKRDPHAATHSKRVAHLSAAIARHMGLDEAQQRTAEIAGRLMNIGKIAIPHDILTAKRSLKAEESALVQRSILTSADLLEGITFEGPILDAIRQSQEMVDGSGPKGLKGDDILLHARIIKAANLYVAMTSARAYRKKVATAEAMRTLLSLIDTALDRTVVMALIHYVEQESGKESLEAISPAS